MSSTYTQNINIEKPGQGEQAGTWGITANNNYDIIDTALDGSISIPLPPVQTTPTAPFSLSTTQGQTTQEMPQGLHKVVTFTGTQSGPGYIQIEPASAQRLYFARNRTGDTAGVATGFPLVFQQVQPGHAPGTAGTTFSLNAGRDAILYTDGAGNVTGAIDSPQFGSMAQTTISLDTTNVMDTANIRRILFTTSGKTRWELQATTGPSDTDVNNPASDLKLLAYVDDAGGTPQISANGSVMYINRASGNMVIGPNVNVPGSAPHGGRLGDARLTVLASTQPTAADQGTLNVVGRASQSSPVFLVQTFDWNAVSFVNLAAVDSAGNLRIAGAVEVQRADGIHSGIDGTLAVGGVTLYFNGGILTGHA